MRRAQQELLRCSNRVRSVSPFWGLMMIAANDRVTGFDLTKALVIGRGEWNEYFEALGTRAFDYLSLPPRRDELDRVLASALGERCREKPKLKLQFEVAGQLASRIRRLIGGCSCFPSVPIHLVKRSSTIGKAASIVFTSVLWMMGSPLIHTQSSIFGSAENVAKLILSNRSKVGV